MSSRSTRPNGHQWIFFSFAGKRHTIRLGAVTLSDAGTFQRNLDRAIQTKSLGLEFDPEIRHWLTLLGDRHHANLATAGLVEPRGARTLGDLKAAFLVHLKREGAKPRTIANVNVVLRNLVEHFTEERHLGKITPDDVAEFRSELRDFGRVGGGSLERTTVSRRVRRAREIFSFAVDRGWIPANPFAKQKKWSEVNTARDAYVTTKTATRLIEAAPSLEWKALIAITRFAGLRCPSEIHPLLWDWVNWDEHTFRVFAPKTEHHPGKDWRHVPLFEELAVHLKALYATRLVGQTHIFPNCQATGSALTAKLARICRDAGVEPWPKAWVNLRASCERDMLLHHPIDDCASWLGHSPETALRHYNRVVKDQRTREAGGALRLFKPPQQGEVKSEAS